MAVSILFVELYLPGNRSLKEKRQTLQSLKMNLRNKFNVSVAETGHQNLWQRAELTVAAAASDKDMARNVIDSAYAMIERRDGVDVIGQDIENL